MGMILRKVYLFILLLLCISFNANAKCAFNCKKVESKPNYNLTLWDIKNADNEICNRFNSSPSVIKTSKKVTRYKYPHKLGKYEYFIDENSRNINWAISEEIKRSDYFLDDLAEMKQNILKAAKDEAFTSLDWSKKGGASPAFATSLIIKNISYIYSYLNFKKQFSKNDKKLIKNWVDDMLSNTLKRASTLDTRIAAHNALILWGSAFQDDGYYENGKKFFYNDLNKNIKKNGTFAKGVRHNNEVMHQLIHGAVVLSLNGEDIYSTNFKGFLLHDIIKIHSQWVIKEGSSKTKTEGDMRDEARSIMKSQGYGTHLAWIPIYLSRFNNNEAVNSVIELKNVLRMNDRKPFYGYLFNQNNCVEYLS